VTTTDEGLAAIRALAPAENWLAVLVTTRPDGEPAVSVVNAGILPHPRSGDPVVALLSRGRTAKLRNLRANPKATLVFRSGHRRPPRDPAGSGSAPPAHVEPATPARSR
jgi:hypothetical protein